MQPNRLVAVDSNILFSLAQEKEEVIDAWHLICERLRPVMLVVPPTVLGEVGDKVARPETNLGRLALKVLRELRARWNFQPVELRPDQEKTTVYVARQIIARGLVPAGEKNDALIVAESAVLECTLLVSDDSHLDGIDRSALKSLLAKAGLNSPVIATPRVLLRKFHR
jgi:predicted nucleic acid-binding protein